VAIREKCGSSILEFAEGFLDREDDMVRQGVFALDIGGGIGCRAQHFEKDRAVGIADPYAFKGASAY
jgi:hypothetical protein